MSNQHHVKTQSWVGGILKTVEHFFDSFEDALAHTKSQTIEHANGSDAYNIKIYNNRKEVIHAVTTHPAVPASSYA
jgi:hypothetical protein